MTAAGANPFSPRAVLALVLAGGALFAAMLWMIGAGMTGGSANDGGAHAGGKGLNGYAALAGLLERRGLEVRRLRSEGGFGAAGLLVLTPPHDADGEEIDKIVTAHRQAGPTLIIAPKWVAGRVPSGTKGARRGWTQLAGAQSPKWSGFLDDVGVTILRRNPSAARWSGLGLSGALPNGGAVQGFSAGALVPLVRDGSGRAIAAYVADGGDYPALAAAARADERVIEGSDAFPIVVVAEPDLLNNYGMADRQRALLALRLIDATLGDQDMPVLFDLTLNGHARSANLLTLAFTPPFLAATLCLLLAALVVGWRAFLRFGPPRVGTRAIALGKRALVVNAAGLIRRSGRLHLIAAPYAVATRERLARALALPRAADAAAAEGMIDDTLMTRDASSTPFSVTSGRLRAARKPHEILHAAQDLHALERTLTR